MARRPHLRQSTISSSGTGYRPKAPPRFRFASIPWFALSVLTLAGLVGWWLFGSGKFSIRTVSVTGSVNPGVNQALNALKGKNILLLSTTQLESTLPHQQSSIAALHLIKGLPDTLRVNVTVRQPQLRWQSRDTQAFLDDAGIVFSLDPAPSPAALDGLPLVADPKAQPIVLGQPFVTPSFVQFVRKLHQNFHDRVHLDFASLAVGETTRELDVTTNNHLTIRFDTTRSLDPQLTTLAAVLSTYGSAIHESVDLRVEGRAFYK